MGWLAAGTEAPVDADSTAGEHLCFLQHPCKGGRCGLLLWISILLECRQHLYSRVALEVFPIHHSVLHSTVHGDDGIAATVRVPEPCA